MFHIRLSSLKNNILVILVSLVMFHISSYIDQTISQAPGSSACLGWKSSHAQSTLCTGNLANPA